MLNIKTAKRKTPLPEDFETLEAAADFWDAHRLTDYWEDTEPAIVEVRLTRRAYWVALEPDLAEQVTAQAAAKGISPETLINLWVAEHVKLPTPQA